MSIPNGLAPHYLWQMDGRIWVENAYAAGTDRDNPALTRAVERGWATPIPHGALAALVTSTLEASTMSTQSTDQPAKPVTRWVTVEASVKITINDPDVIQRVVGPDGDEWRAATYDIRSEAGVLEHFAYNAVANGVGRCNVLDGWADLLDDAATFDVVGFEAQP